MLTLVMLFNIAVLGTECDERELVRDVAGELYDRYFGEYHDHDEWYDDEEEWHHHDWDDEDEWHGGDHGDDSIEIIPPAPLDV